MLTERKESVVFIDDDLCRLRYRRIVPGSLRLFDEAGNESLREGTDFSVDYAAGSLRAASEKPRNYHESAFYGLHGFDHNSVQTYGNGPFTYYASYTFDETGQTTNRQKAKELAAKSPKITSLPSKARYVVFGDSISTGREASSLKTAFFSIFAQALRERFGGVVDLINGSVGGDSSADGLKHFEKDALAQHPDICTLGFGMNDQNAQNGGRHFVEPPEYEQNIRSMIEALLKEDCAVVLVAPCRPNPRWKWTSGDTGLYADVLRRLAGEYRLPFADVTALWDFNLLCGKTPESLLHNDINHPNDFGHSIYGDALCALISPSAGR